VGPVLIVLFCSCLGSASRCDAAARWLDDVIRRDDPDDSESQPAGTL